MASLSQRFHPLKRQTWWPRPGNGFALSELLHSANAHASLVERHIWLIRLIDWIRRGEPVSGTQAVLGTLAQDDALREQVLGVMAAFWRDMDVAALLADYGFSPRSSFLNEFGERLRRRVLPQSPDTADLAALFQMLFDDGDDPRWLMALDDHVLQALAELLCDALSMDIADLAPGQAGSRRSALGWREPFYDAMLYLATQVRAAAFSPAFRSRVGTRVDLEFDAQRPGASSSQDDADARVAFRQLARVIERMHELALQAAQRPQAQAPWPAELLHEAHYLRALLDCCVQAARGLHGHLELHGISVDLVFQIDQMCERCDRIGRMVDVVLSPQPSLMVRALVVDLVHTGLRRRSIRALFTQHYAMLARKVAERSAQTGEHYITRDAQEYLQMLGRAGGGGAVLAVTTYVKFMVLGLGLSAFWSGMGAGLNYALSFVIVQWLHFTVATKQPAMTAPAMAARLGNTRSHEGMEAFVDEVAHLIRSQVAGIVGNLCVVAPVVLMLQGLAWVLAGRPLISASVAHHVLDSLSLWGPSAWYAAFTGVLLFASSLIAGWLENWFVLYKLESAIRWNPHIRAWLGVERAARWSLWWGGNVSGLAANVSLGMLLGVVPAVARFLGLPLDVRHVTLSTGQLMAALGSLGPQLLHDGAFWWCAAALPVTGLLNVGVSFGLALLVAMRSRNVRFKDRARLGAAIWQRLRHRPLSYLLPPRKSA